MNGKLAAIIVMTVAVAAGATVLAYREGYNDGMKETLLDIGFANTRLVFATEAMKLPLFFSGDVDKLREMSMGRLLNDTLWLSEQYLERPELREEAREFCKTELPRLQEITRQAPPAGRLNADLLKASEQMQVICTRVSGSLVVCI